MIEASLQMGFRVGREGQNSKKLTQMGRVGHSLGLAFQAVYDLLDVTQTTAQLGKDAHHDCESGKITCFPKGRKRGTPSRGAKHRECSSNAECGGWRLSVLTGFNPIHAQSGILIQ